MIKRIYQIKKNQIVKDRGTSRKIIKEIIKKRSKWNNDIELERVLNIQFNSFVFLCQMDNGHIILTPT